MFFAARKEFKEADLTDQNEKTGKYGKAGETIIIVNEFEK